MIIRPLTFFLAVVAAPALAAPKIHPAALGKPAPLFVLNDQDGKPVSLAALRGKWVVLEWVNPACPFWCAHAKAGTMKQLAAKYAPQGVVWLGINTTNTADAAVNGKARGDYGLTYAVLDDHEGKVGRMYGAKTTPHLFIVNPKGLLVYKGAIDSGPDDDPHKVNYVDQGLAELLAGKPCSVPETKPYGCGVKYR